MSVLARIGAMKSGTASSARRRGGYPGAQEQETVMNENDDRQQRVRGSSGRRVLRTLASRPLVVAAAAGLAVLLLGSAHRSAHGPVPAQAAAAQAGGEAPAPSGAIDFFPAQFDAPSRDVPEQMHPY